MRRLMMVVMGIGLVWASAEDCFARGPQGGGQRNTMQQTQARHRYGGQYQGTGQEQSANPGQGNAGNGLQQRKRDGVYHRASWC